ncbi:MAG TPA: AAA family ATPase, partial [Candidatus Dormibacteraeota bacterium]|nr:AAA family ATPase [Candidatus Dormibacteraeota bacterium]
VIVIAATNRPDVLDPALLRPGRFDRHVTLDRPDIKGRMAILQVHAKNKPLDSTVSLETLAKQTPGFSGADLSNLINEAAILAARNNKKSIGMPELEESIIRVMAGPERKSRVISDKEKNIVAYHEIGHALVARDIPDTDPVHKISVISRGQALGWTAYLPEEDRYLASKRELEDRIAMALGGRCAEEVMFGDITSGAGDDIRRVTDIARNMVTQLGMSTKLGPRAFGGGDQQVFLGRDIGSERNYSEDVAGEIDKEIHEIVQRGYDRAKEILERRKSDMIVLAEYLKEVETMDGDEMDRVMSGELKPPSQGGPPIIDQLKPLEIPAAPDAERPVKGEEGRGGRPLRPEPSPS